MTATATKTQAEDELARIDPEPVRLKLQSGIEVDVVPLKTRQMFRLLRVITRGGANVLPAIRLAPDQSVEEFAAQLIGLVVFALGDAEDEAVDFIRSMVRPANLTGDAQEDRGAWEELYAALENPEIDDTLSIVEAVIQREAADLKALGSRLRSMYEMARKMSGPPPKKATKSKESSEESPEPST